MYIVSKCSAGSKMKQTSDKFGTTINLIFNIECTIFLVHCINQKYEVLQNYREERVLVLTEKLHWDKVLGNRIPKNSTRIV